ncbi:DUF302 domain-containing protein [Aquimarina sp. ERC-38]|uniref:DUF302 domain-containing protein n=1 Tax=Aquimarina sp. ERC-38 TaxID=2949996 RepID=UPI0022451FD4|nr:DUF302 domain-containing protein [Aquimarina sp. ERC-38]UZO81015.1 DUF302 domain-containing protein [Aquimarina sp. ERC-38]
MKTTLNLIVLSLVFIISCKEDDSTDPDPTPEPIVVPGLTFAPSNQSFFVADLAISQALESAEPVSVLAAVNHRNNASSVGKELRNTKVFIFGNPMLGTALMQANQLVGLDLPQKLFLWEDAQDSVRVGFNNVAYLQARHGLQDLPQLEAINGALNNFATLISNGVVVSNDADTIEVGEGIITKESTNSFEDTYNTLVGAIEGNENLRLVATLDHQANAESIGEELNPTRLIIFGNPNLGTPLMQNSQSTGIDLPQKFLVWEDADGNVKISYNDPAYLVKRHGITDNDDTLATITGALNNLSNAAAGL